ncbi:N(6)-adenine-specific methyltransferase METTL4-like [Liolophura sinensis]|uniref:N(6)-adenine-specific methyltransferase METTL4-like n=1 Tax=Liolophura sinensis TaxID=3198878 RepID=UPI00315925CA
MAVIAWCEEGWLLDHMSWWRRSYSLPETCEPVIQRNFTQTGDKLPDDINTAVHGTCDISQLAGGNSILSNLTVQNQYKYIPKQELFSIFHPYLMDSEFENYAARLRPSAVTTADPEKIEAGKKRKRKRKHKDDEYLLQDDKMTECISQAMKSLVKLGLLTGHFRELSTLPINNNTEARQLAKQDSSDMAVSVGNVLEPVCEGLATVVLSAGQCYSYPELCHTLYKHEGPTPMVIRCDGHQYVVPPYSGFCLSQAAGIRSFISALDGEKFDLIVMDPPWENKSVKRKKMYYTLPNWDLQDLPIPDLARDRCLLAVWVTNKHKHQDYVRHVLFPRWSVKHLADWYWLKVTVAGEPITGLASHCKKPYESLILGRYQPNHHGIERTDNPLGSPPEDKVVMSVPCILHSKKPPIDALLTDYCNEKPHCLELFARNLRPGWISWGNEVLRHQHLKFYDVSTCSSETSCNGAEDRDHTSTQHSGKI